MAKKRKYWGYLRWRIKSDVTYSVDFVQDLPESVSSNTIYVVGEKPFYWQIALRCPCGCRELIQLNLIKKSYPQWEFSVNSNNRITIYPSIWRTRGCESHFIIRNNQCYLVLDNHER